MTFAHRKSKVIGFWSYSRGVKCDQAFSSVKADRLLQREELTVSYVNWKKKRSFRCANSLTRSRRSRSSKAKWGSSDCEFFCFLPIWKKLHPKSVGCFIASLNRNRPCHIDDATHWLKAIKAFPTMRRVCLGKNVTPSLLTLSGG